MKKVERANRTEDYKELIKRIESFLDHTSSRKFSVDIIHENLLIVSVDNDALNHHTVAICTNDTFICTDIKYRATFEILSDDFLDFVYKAGYNYICTDYDESYSSDDVDTIALNPSMN